MGIQINDEDLFSHTINRNYIGSRLLRVQLLRALLIDINAQKFRIQRLSTGYNVHIFMN